MELHVFTEPQQGASYQQLSRYARLAEELGFSGFFRSDHLLAIGGAPGTPGPTDTWATLAALALETSRIRLGTLVTCATFRLPGPLAIAAAQVDLMSQGRLDFGIGAGWYAAEHRAYGIPFPPMPERFDRLEEQLQVITGMWSTPEGGRFSFPGRHYQLLDAPALPKPHQRPGPPVLIGGMGRRRTPQLAARFAAEFNVAFRERDAVARQFQRVRQACAAAGRDPASLRLSVALTACCGASEAELKRRAQAIGRDLDELRRLGAAGSPDQVRARLQEFDQLGCARVYLQMLDLDDVEHLRLIAAEVLPGWS
ncbi:MAG: LLM class F420-dependent oxidoreductase [Candidatus Dormibacteria bacterium]